MNVTYTQIFETAKKYSGFKFPTCCVMAALKDTGKSCLLHGKQFAVDLSNTLARFWCNS
jgi:hypothetical protein